jgi:hypothetical protein
MDLGAIGHRSALAPGCKEWEIQDHCGQVLFLALEMSRIQICNVAPDSSRRNNRYEKHRLSDGRLDFGFPQLAMRDCSFVLP